MKKLLVVLVLAFTAVAVLAPVVASAQAGGSQAPLDPAEYNSYVSAVQSTNVQEKIAGLEGFLQRYPNSTVKEAALEQLMTAYQQAGNASKVFETADKLLQAFPNNLRGLAVMVYSKRQAALSGQDPQQNAAQAEQYAQRGLEALKTAAKPEGMADADFNKFKEQVGGIFNGAVGFGELQKKNFPQAAQGFQAAVAANPNSFYDIYYLGVAMVQQTPINPLGLFYLARAANLNSDPDVMKFGKYYYQKYHGAPDGWEQVLAQAKDSSTPPPGFTVTPAPSPAEQARNLANSKDPKQMTFDELQIILAYGTQDVVDKVWGAIKGQPLPFVAKVVEASRTKLTLGATYENFQSGTADVEVTMIAPIPAASLPKKGDTIQVQAKPDSYTAKPFLVQMIDGQLIQQKKPPATKKPPARHRKKG